MNLKKLRRIDSEEKLQVKRIGGRKRALGTQRPMEVLTAINVRWSLDFVSDALTDGRRFRILALIADTFISLGLKGCERAPSTL